MKKAATKTPANNSSASLALPKRLSASLKAGCLMRPIGVIRTPFPEPAGTPLEPSRAGDARGVVHIAGPYRKALLDLEGFDHVWLIFWLHKAPAGKPLVTPFLDDRAHGLFATRAPARFNPIGISALRLCKVHEDRIEVAGVDIVDGTPVLDIKPYIPEFDCHPDSSPGWFAANRNQATRADARFSTQSPNKSAKKSADNSASAKFTELRLAITGMKCPKCIPKVRAALASLSGVRPLSVQIGTATLRYDATKVRPAQITGALAELGFRARRSAAGKLQ